MEPTTTQHLHIVAGLLVAVIFALLVVAKVGGKFLDDWWDKGKVSAVKINGNGNGNGDMKKVCFMGQGGAEQIMDRIDGQHERLRDMIHQNHAAVLAVLTELSRILSSRTQTESDISLTLKLIERHMAKYEDTHGLR